MKNLIYSLLFIFISSTLVAQNNKNYKSFYTTYKKEKSIIGISAPIRLANLFIDHEEKELREIVRKGKKVRILVFDEINTEINDAVKAYLPSNTYQKFLTIKDGDSRIKLLVREHDEAISEIIILIKDESSFVTLGIYGDFTYDDLSSLSNNFQSKS